MFTGLVEAASRVLRVEANAESKSDRRLWIELPKSWTDVQVGESIAVNGCCLTVAELEKKSGAIYCAFDLLAETCRVTNLGDVSSEGRVNLERALRVDSRLGGHFVTGHIDAVGRVQAFEKRGSDYYLQVEIEPVDARWLIPKGSIAVDGVSLTVAEVSANWFSVWIIPHTREVTTLADCAPGTGVNLEFDLLAKYADKLLAASGKTG